MGFLKQILIEANFNSKIAQQMIKAYTPRKHNKKKSNVISRKDAPNKKDY
jgi:hypothetical protein